MPELPEVETIARGLAPDLAGAVITGATELRAGMVEGDRQGFFARLPGARVTGVGRRGKLLLLFLSSGDTLAFHLKMSGSLMVHPAGTPPGKHTRVIFALEDGRQLFFDDIRTFGFCRLVNETDKSEWPFWKNLGPEPLELAPEEFARQLSGSLRSVKALLLDQTVIAGIGNIYADESLFRAKINPLRPASDLTPRRLAILGEKVREVLEEAIDQCGSSIRDYRDAHGNAGAFQNSFRVYGRAGQPCVNCGTTLEGARVAGRASVYCPKCQKK